jgi:hypothetical protein
LRILGRWLRRLIVGLGALAVLLYSFGDRLARAWLDPACSERLVSSLANTRGDVAEVTVKGCILGLLDREHRSRIHPSNGSAARIVVRFVPREQPDLHCLGEDHLQVDLGHVRSVTPQIRHIGTIHVTFTYSGMEPSLD